LPILVTEFLSILELIKAVFVVLQEMLLKVSIVISLSVPEFKKCLLKPPQGETIICCLDYFLVEMIEGFI
jgi:hypothetical protein